MSNKKPALSAAATDIDPTFTLYSARSKLQVIEHVLLHNDKHIDQDVAGGLAELVDEVYRSLDGVIDFCHVAESKTLDEPHAELTI